MEERFLVFDYTKKVECTVPMDHRKISQAYEEKCEAPSSTLGLNVENEVRSIINFFIWDDSSDDNYF